MADYQVIVIGGGPGGYVAALRCAQLGFSTACIDQRRTRSGQASLGGTCLNIGCIPSKALLESSEQFHLAGELAEHGVKIGGVGLDLAQMHKRKDGVVQALTGGIAQLLEANKITNLTGHATLLADRRVEFREKPRGKPKLLQAEHVILAPGSLPVELPDQPFDHQRVVDSTGALAFPRVPKRLGVIGAGVIGLELGSVWNRLGAQVVLLEAMDEFLAGADPQIAREAAKQFKSQGLDIRLGAKLERIQRMRGGLLTLHYRQGDKATSVKVDRVIIAVGRRPATDGLLNPESGVRTDARGFITVDAECRTDAAQVWAIGDAVRGPMLAHKASEEGVAVAERIAGQRPEVHFDTIPWVIYTAPEIAWVGATEPQLKEQGIAYRSGAFPFAANPRARALGDTRGFAKLLADATTDRILGAHLIGPQASELIGELVLGMEFSASAEDLARTVHAHPTLSETLHEAALAVDLRALHRTNRGG